MRAFTLAAALVYAIVVGAFIILHAPNGDEIHVNGGEVMLITPGGPPLTTPGCKSDVLVHDKWVCVKESPREVRRLIEETRD